MDGLKPCLTLNKKFDGYCRICWNPVYALWIDDFDHEGKCPLGHAKAHECPDALGRAQLSADMARLRSDGLISPATSTQGHGAGGADADA